MSQTRGMTRPMLAAAAIIVAVAAAPLTVAHAQDIMKEWASVKAPGAPKVTAVTVDPKTTAIISMDFNSKNCTAEDRKRCFAVIPHVQKVLAEARKNGMVVAHSITSHMKPTDVVKAVAPLPGEDVVVGHGDKFAGSNLEKVLKDKGIKTVVLMGTEANSAVLYTALGAVVRGFKVVVPVDTMPAKTAYQEQFTVWELAHGSQLKDAVTLTRSDMLKF
jgi:nicotinamidase-related amidase